MADKRSSGRIPSSARREWIDRVAALLREHGRLTPKGIHALLVTQFGDVTPSAERIGELLNRSDVFRPLDDERWVTRAAPGSVAQEIRAALRNRPECDHGESRAVREP